MISNIDALHLRSNIEFQIEKRLSNEGIGDINPKLVEIDLLISSRNASGSADISKLFFACITEKNKFWL